jgi:RAB6A-GEF complex partner protein 1
VPLLHSDQGLHLYRGFDQSALDIINPESRSFARFQWPSEYIQEYSPLRLMTISSDGRYLSIAAKIGFAHLSTTSGRWRVLETFEGMSPDVPGEVEHVPHVRGGMCWYGNILLVGAVFGDSNEVRSFTGIDSPIGSPLSSKCNRHGTWIMVASRSFVFNDSAYVRAR